MKINYSFFLASFHSFRSSLFFSSNENIPERTFDYWSFGQFSHFFLSLCFLLSFLLWLLMFHTRILFLIWIGLSVRETKGLIKTKHQEEGEEEEKRVNLHSYRNIFMLNFICFFIFIRFVRNVKQFNSNNSNNQLSSLECQKHQKDVLETFFFPSQISLSLFIPFSLHKNIL